MGVGKSWVPVVIKTGDTLDISGCHSQHGPEAEIVVGSLYLFKVGNLLPCS